MNEHRNTPHNNSSQHSSLTLTMNTTMMMLEELERGPRYEAYAELRETKLRMKYLRQQQQEYEEQEEYEEEEERKAPTPPKKQVKFRESSSVRKVWSSAVAQSVPDFSAALRKENRKPVVNMLPTVMELTPPSKTKNTASAAFSASRGSKSANAGEKKRGGGGVLMARKSYASIHELNSTFSSATATSINAQSRGLRSSTRAMAKKNVLSYRYL